MIYFIKGKYEDDYFVANFRNNISSRVWASTLNQAIKSYGEGDTSSWGIRYETDDKVIRRYIDGSGFKVLFALDINIELLKDKNILSLSQIEKDYPEYLL